jgi:hypothetical protein
MRSGKLGANAGSIQLLDRLAVGRLGLVAIAKKRPTTRFDAEREAASGGLRGRREGLQCIPRALSVADMRGRLDKFDLRPHREPRKDAVRGDLSGRRCGLLVVSEAVVEHGGGPVRSHHSDALPE